VSGAVSGVIAVSMFVDLGKNAHIYYSGDKCCGT
jgi:hypothetical protein